MVIRGVSARQLTQGTTQRPSTGTGVQCPLTCARNAHQCATCDAGSQCRSAWKGKTPPVCFMLSVSVLLPTQKITAQKFLTRSFPQLQNDVHLTSTLRSHQGKRFARCECDERFSRFSSQRMRHASRPWMQRTLCDPPSTHHVPDPAIACLYSVASPVPQGRNT